MLVRILMVVGILFLVAASLIFYRAVVRLERLIDVLREIGSAIKQALELFGNYQIEVSKCHLELRSRLPKGDSLQGPPRVN